MICAIKIGLKVNIFSSKERVSVRKKKHPDVKKDGLPFSQVVRVHWWWDNEERTPK
jgi:hypothetical protein